MDASRFHWTAAEERRGGPGIMITAFVNESIGWLKLSSQDMAAINAKRTIEGILPCKYFTAHKGCYYAFMPFSMAKLMRATEMETRCLSR